MGGFHTLEWLLGKDKMPYKTCPKCSKKSGVRSFFCECGHEFIPKEKPPIETEKESDKLEKGSRRPKTIKNKN